jgi:hypothetical protein
VLGSGEFEIKCPCFALRQRQRRATASPACQQIRIAFIARFQVFDSDPHILARRQAADLELSVLIRARALDETGVWSAFALIVGKQDDGRIERDRVSVV